MAEDASSFWTDIQRFEDMLAADPLSHCFAPLSELYRRIGLVDDAISVAKKGCSTHPDYYGGFLALGAACFDKGLHSEARRALERVLALRPDDARAQKLLGQLYADAGEVALAKRLLGQVVQQAPEDLESDLLLRSLSVSSGERVEEELLEEAEIIEEPADALELDDHFEEVEELVLTEEPEAPPWSEEPPLSGEAGGRAEDELDESDEFWAIPPVAEPAAAPPKKPQGNPLTTATMAELYASQGFVDKALAVYRELLASDPGNELYLSRVTELGKLGGSQGGGRPADQTAAAETTRFAAPGSPQASPADLENGLNRWLENVRRRKDGA